MRAYVDAITSKELTWVRLSEQYPDGTLWDGDVSYKDVEQGSRGNPFFVGALAAVSERPELIKDAFITQQFNKHGVYVIRFFIRGKPWLVSVDDEIAFDARQNRPYFANVATGRVVWPALVEKAFAKLKGTYSFVDDQTSATALRALTGAPTYTYQFTGSKVSDSDMWDILNDGDQKGYPMAMATHPSDGSGDLSGCGLPMGQAYHLISTFRLDDFKMLMLRVPTGKSMEAYIRRWNWRDTKNWI